ncbi:heparan-alpha-glucosaminide N-acetyltransferase domain-containing protein [Amycolatopsis samaneae]
MPKARLLGIDVVRALAIIGVFVEHFHMNGWFTAGPVRDPGPALLHWVDTETSSRAMSLFVLLAGVSVALMTGGSRPYAGKRMRTAVLRVLVRAVTLWLISLCIDQFAPSVIGFYAVLLVFLLPFTWLRPRTLFVLSGISVPLVTAYAMWVLSSHMDWMRSDTPEGLAVLTHPGSWGQYFFSLVSVGGGFQVVYGIPLVLAGLAIGRLDLHSRVVRIRMLVTGLCVALGAVVVSFAALKLFGVEDLLERLSPADQAWQQVLAMPGERSLYATSVVGIVFMIGVALALLGGFLMLVDRPRWRRLLWPLAAAGGMTMTWYAGHLIYQSALGQPKAYSFVYFCAVVAVTLVASVLWRRWIRRGPLEWLVHKVITTVVPAPKRP